MKRRSIVLLVLSFAVLPAVLALGAVFAFATPSAGIESAPVLARGTVGETVVLGTPTVVTVTKRVKVRISRRKTVTKRVSIKVNTVRPILACRSAGSCETAVQRVTIRPGGHTGWHTHPGATWVAIAEGEGTLYNAGESGCPGHKFGANSGFYQTQDDIHTLRNEAAANLVLYAFYALPANTPNTAIRTDQALPSSCPNIP